MHFKVDRSVGSLLGSRDGTVVKVLASPQSGQGWIPGFTVICSLIYGSLESRFNSILYSHYKEHLHTNYWPSSCVTFQSNIMQMKLIQKIKFVGKVTQESIRGIKFTVWGRRIKPLTCNLMHKFENALTLCGFVIFLNLESS